MSRPAPFPVTLCVIPLVLSPAFAADPPAKGDPDATKLLADAIAAKDTWDNFPGFTADVVFNRNGKSARGTVTVAANTQVTADGLPNDADGWVEETLGFIARHRMPPKGQTPCVFADDGDGHPLGRAVRTLSDRSKTVYRVKDRQVMVVDRTTKTERFVIAVQQNLTTREGKYLPATYTVYYWGPDGGAPRKAEGFAQTWARVGGFDLPVTITYTSGDATGLTVDTLALSGHKLLTPAQ